MFEKIENARCASILLLEALEKVNQSSRYGEKNPKTLFDSIVKVFKPLEQRCRHRILMNMIKQTCTGVVSAHFIIRYVLSSTLFKSRRSARPSEIHWFPVRSSVSLFRAHRGPQVYSVNQIHQQYVYIKF